MASAITKYGAAYVLDVLFGGRQPVPSSYYVALIAQAPGEDTDGDSLTEPDTEAGYARVEISNDALSWAAADGNVITTDTSVVFAAATGDWPVITHFALCDALVGGNVYLYGGFNIPRRINIGDQARIPANQLSLTATSLTTAIVSTF
jgi:hypothetical protein